MDIGIKLEMKAFYKRLKGQARSFNDCNNCVGGVGHCIKTFKREVQGKVSVRRSLGYENLFGALGKVNYAFTDL